MSRVCSLVLSTVNAPYGTRLTADELAERIANPESAARCDAAAFAFFSDVDRDLQTRFIREMKIDPLEAAAQARRFSKLAGYRLPLAGTS